MPPWLLIAHACATWLMTGLIWFVQLVHYPLMGRVGAEQWAEYARHHRDRTTWIVAPTMLAELGTGAALVFPGWAGRAGVEPSLAWIGLALLGAVWGSTFLLQVPQHARLSTGFDAATHRRLVAGNWVRTAAWSARAILVATMLATPAPVTA